MDRSQDAALFAREVQDEILRLRSESGRVPEWLYRRMRANYNDDMLETAETLAKEWVSAGGSGPPAT